MVFPQGLEKAWRCAVESMEDLEVRPATPITPRLFARRHVDFARVNSALCS
jgi:hypothetical protein